MKFIHQNSDHHIMIRNQMKQQDIVVVITGSYKTLLSTFDDMTLVQCCHSMCSKYNFKQSLDKRIMMQSEILLHQLFFSQLLCGSMLNILLDVPSFIASVVISAN